MAPSRFVFLYIKCYDLVIIENITQNECIFALIIQNGQDYKKEDIRMCPQSRHNEEQDQPPEDKRTYSKSYEKELMTKILKDSLLCLCRGMSEPKVGKSYSMFEGNQSLRYIKLERK